MTLIKKIYNKWMESHSRSFQVKFYYKLLAVLGVTSVMILTASLSGYKVLQEAFQAQSDTMIDRMHRLIELSEIQKRLHRLHLLETDIRFRTAERNVEPQHLDSLIKDVDTRLAALLTHDFAQISETANQLANHWRKYHNQLKQMMTGGSAAAFPPHPADSPSFDIGFQTLLDRLDTLIQHENRQVETRRLSADISLQRRRQFFQWISIAGVLTGFMAIMVLSLSLTRRIQYLKQGIAGLTDKDWRHSLRIRGNDEVTDLTITFIEMRAELYQREQALIESERKHRTLIENLPEYIFYKDRQFTFITCNEKFARLFNLSSDQIIGKDDHCLFPASSAEHFQQEDQTIVQSGTPWETEYHFRQNGHDMWLHVIKTPVRDKYGHITGLLGVMRDITDDKIAHEQLQASEEKFRQLAENINQVFFIIDKATRKMLYVSPAYETLWPHSREQLLTSPHIFMEAIHPEDRPEVQSVYEALFQNNKPCNHEYRLVSPDGKIRWIQDRCFPIENENGEIYRFARIAEDITERIALYTLIRENEERYRCMFEENHAVMLLIDPHDGTVVDANPAACEFYGYDRSSLTRMSITDMTSLPETETFQTIHLAMEKGRDVHISKHRVANGERRDVKIYTVAIHIHNRELLYGIIHDITDRMRAEQKIQQRLKIENALTKSAQMLMSSDDADLDRFMALIGHAFAVDSACLFRIQGPDRRTDLIHEWHLATVEDRIRQVCAMDGMETVQREKQANGDPQDSICAMSILCNHTTPPSLSNLNGNRSALCVPIFSEADAISGFIFIENFFTSRHWLSEDVDALGLAAELVGSHWNRIDSRRELIRERQRLAGFLDGHPIPTILINQKHQIELWNRACEALTGIMKDEVLHKRLSSRMFPLELKAERPLLANCVLEKDESLLHRIYGPKKLSPSSLIPHAFEALEVLDFGEGEKEFFLHAARVCDAGGNVLGAIETLQDISQQQRAIKALIKSEKRFRELVENLQVGLCIIKQENIVYMNPRQKELLGLNDSILQQSLSLKDIRVFPGDSEKFKHAYDMDYLSDHHTLDQIIRLFPRTSSPEGNEPIWLNCRSSLIEYQDEQAVLITMGDITHFKQLEKTLQVREKMASLGNVATGIAHEIRNPLSGINIMLDCIKETFEDPDNADDIKELIIQAQKATHKIETVIKTVLDFSRPSPVKLIETNIHRPVTEAVNLCRTTLRKTGIELKVEMEDHLPQVFIDRQLIEQVILNIINNAAESLRESSSPKRITLSVCRIKNDVIIIISDSGPGIPEELQEKIFEPFFTTKTNGSGIGLSICQRIILDHGGTLQVSPAEGGGTEFIITIPVEKRGIQYRKFPKKQIYDG